MDPRSKYSPSEQNFNSDDFFPEEELTFGGSKSYNFNDNLLPGSGFSQSIEFSETQLPFAVEQQPAEYFPNDMWMPNPSAGPTPLMVAPGMVMIEPLPLEVVEPSNSGGGGEKKKIKKAIRWSKEEHRLFLIGMKIHKKGDWKSISRYLVTTRSAAQVTSHAQKFFKRKQSQPITGDFRKKRTSIHDIKVEDVVDDPIEIEYLKKIIEQQRRSE